MQVRVLLFGVLKDILPAAASTVDLPDGATVDTLLDYFRGEKPTRDELWDSLAVAVNHDYAPRTLALSDGDEVALLPPVSGGAQASHIALVREPIHAESLVANLKQGEDGAVVVFDGIVRNNTRGRRTLHLVYEAYEEMALKQMRELAQQAIEQFSVREVFLVHRLGKLEIGETSVLIAVASAHRPAAFDACRWLIDTLKKTVPIWKKEHFEDGAVWADGEPFPEEMKGVAAS
ncbi:molybdenum cofactor biosynthesis protein MoaE [Acidobacterium sp. S8]|uniref:molybdenum cofactor biosynthesis protein n=1 Tax=Acidobacterium sp. S8 TaxID=1641854 RepID=UPI00131EBFD1|nr:molybdenum cofactor biosynthesis protein MoaE [Acidobacterium sp. S8]